MHYAVRDKSSGVRGLNQAREQALRGTLTQLAGFLGKSGVSCLLAFSASKSNFYGFWISSWDINGREESNNDASKNKSSVSLETPQNFTRWKEAFLKVLESPRFCIVSMENEITPFLALKCFSSYFTPGSQICQGPAGHYRVWWLMAKERQEKGKHGLKLVPNRVWKARFEIRLPGLMGEAAWKPCNYRRKRVIWILDSGHAEMVS